MTRTCELQAFDEPCKVVNDEVVCYCGGISCNSQDQASLQELYRTRQVEHVTDDVTEDVTEDDSDDSDDSGEFGSGSRPHWMSTESTSSTDGWTTVTIVRDVPTSTHKATTATDLAARSGPGPGTSTSTESDIYVSGSSEQQEAESTTLSGSGSGSGAPGSGSCVRSDLLWLLLSAWTALRWRPFAAGH